MKLKSKFHFSKISSVRIVLCAGLTVLGFTSQAHANNSWDGGGAPVGGLWNWSDNTNWGADTAPTLPGALIFTGTSGPSSNNDLAAGNSITGITFSAGSGPFVISGNSISLDGNIAVNSTTAQKIDLPVVLTGLRQVSTNQVAGSLTLGGVIGGGNTGGLQKLGGGTLNITGTANTYGGISYFNAGVVNVASLSDYGVAGSLGNRAVADDGNGIGLLFRTGTLQYTGSTAQSTNRSIRVHVFGGAIDASGSNTGATLNFTTGSFNYENNGAREFTLTGTNTGNNTFGIAIGESGGATSLTKSSSGKWVLSGVSTYSGNTSVSAGTLALASTGSINNTTGISLGTTSTTGIFDVSAKSGGYAVKELTGSGSAIGGLSVSTRLAIGVSGGASVGTINFSDSLTLAATTVIEHGLTGGGAAADLGIVAGTLNLAGATLQLTQLGVFNAGDKFTLFSYNTLTGTFAGLADDSTFTDAGGSWMINYNDATAGLNGGSGTGFVTVTAVPEPTTVFLSCLGLVFFLSRRR